MRQAGIFFIENLFVDSLSGYFLVVYSLYMNKSHKYKSTFNFYSSWF